MLRAMGAHVAGAGGPVIVIEGLGPTGRLRGVDHDLMPDRIEAGTFMAAAALLPGSRVVLRGVVPAHLRAASEALRATGCTVRADPAGGALADVQVCAPPAGGLVPFGCMAWHGANRAALCTGTCYPEAGTVTHRTSFRPWHAWISIPWPRHRRSVTVGYHQNA